MITLRLGNGADPIDMSPYQVSILCQMCTIHDALNSYCIYDNVEFHRHNEMFFPSFQGAALNTDFKSKFM